MKITIQRAKDFLSGSRAMMDHFLKERKSVELEIDHLSTRASNLGESIEVMNMVSVVVGDDSKALIEGIVSEALQFIYDQSYSFVVTNKVQRAQPETHFSVKIGNREFSLRDEEIGGGVSDVVSFILRITMWAINDPPLNNALIMDEPLKNLDSERLVKMGEIIKKLSIDFDLQFIIVTHEPQLSEIADATWFVKKVGDTSIVEKV